MQHACLRACVGACALAGILSVSFAQAPVVHQLDGSANADLLTALTLGDLPGLKTLLAAGADPNAFISPIFQGPVWLSSLIMGQEPMFWTMAGAKKLATGSAPGRRGGPDTLAIAAARGYVDVVEHLLDSGVDVNSRLPVGATSILVAAANSNAEIVQMLISRRANVNLSDQHGDTPLMAAVRAGSGRSVNLLLSAGANVNVVDKSGRTAVWWVSRTDRLDILEQLMERGADLNLADENGSTPLMQANRMRQRRMARYLRTNGAIGRELPASPRDTRSAIGASLAVVQTGAELW